MIKTDKIEYLAINETFVDEETAAANSGILHENAVDGPNGKLFTLTFKVVLSEYGKKNWTGRTYTRDVLWNAIEKNPLFQNDIKHKALGMEIQHPQVEKGVNDLSRQLTISPIYVASTLDRYWEEGNLLMGECTTVVGGWGDILRDRILTGIPPMVSSRSVGGVDNKGYVLPNLSVVTWDNCWRPSCQLAYGVPGSTKLNTLSIPSGTTVSAIPMTESATFVVNMNDDSFRDFLLTEAVSREKISIVCDAMNLDYDSMVLTENSLQISKISGNERTTVYMPLNKLVGANAYRLF